MDGISLSLLHKNIFQSIWIIILQKETAGLSGKVVTWSTNSRPNITLGFRLHEHIPEQKEGHSVPLPVFIFVLTRMRPIKEGLPALKIIEIFGHETDKGERVQTADDVIAFVKSKQEWSQMKGFIQKIKPSDEEVNFQLFSPEVDGFFYVGS